MAAALLAAGIVPGAADAATTQPAAATAACRLTVGSVTPGGDHRFRTVAATAPITVQSQSLYSGIYPDGQVRLSGSTASDPDVEPFREAVSGWVVMGSTMYNSGYRVEQNGEPTPGPHTTPVGGGWGGISAFETSRYYPPFLDSVKGVTSQYALRADGVLSRWVTKYATTGGATWTNKQSAPGFSAVKAMALISQTATYDTFLATTKGGALYTIRIPRTSPLKPVVKLVRSSSWQGFESLVIEKCGVNGTMLLGIDKDSKSGYLYAVGHANGTATVIKSLGKVPTTFEDPVYFRRAIRPGDAPMLFGE
ncbi:hypothetical protein [Kribbella sp. VKM Ac-2568]|uniref:hypothetical protein n=1 Tax=Kribbella sp. VKM Ac-2568 TaxID=2512219 RepID=UPI0010F05E04|nr:hypothetical protein [Kribbella sp. VKM Ac-2568]TCM38177.1 hypothetical protein EV648_11749 [Kribbella sp. VKM Ac-2568]